MFETKNYKKIRGGKIRSKKAKVISPNILAAKA